MLHWKSKKTNFWWRQSWCWSIVWTPKDLDALLGLVGTLCCYIMKPALLCFNKFKQIIPGYNEKSLNLNTTSFSVKVLPLTFFSSSSAAFLNSCSKELASSLKSPTSSQFFRNLVGVGVWSVGMKTKGNSILVLTWN